MQLTGTDELLFVLSAGGIGGAGEGRVVSTAEDVSHMSMQCDASDVCVVSFSCSKQHVLK
jgi:hypothetical protein